jgi:hypothetical protein
MLVLHATELANGQALASIEQIGVANLFTFARFQAFGSRFMGGRYGTVFGDIFFGFFAGMAISRYRNSSCSHKQNKGEQGFFHKIFELTAL